MTELYSHLWESSDLLHPFTTAISPQLAFREPAHLPHPSGLFLQSASEVFLPLSTPLPFCFFKFSDKPFVLCIQPTQGWGGGVGGGVLPSEQATFRVSQP